jgi:ABC-type uncharacterized transport system involved in gliding motility auxiliary subunit
MTKKQNRIITILALIVFVLAFLLSSRLYFRLDLTHNKAYTLSPQSKNLFLELDDILRITYYVSDMLASARPEPEEISGFLGEYAANSRGRIQYVREDPAKSDMLREMDFLGIIAQDFQIVDRNEIRSAPVYSGVVIEYLDRAEVMPFVFSLSTLEYDISSRILLLARGKSRELGVIIGDSSKYWNVDYALLEAGLTQAGYRVMNIVPGEEIPDSLPVLFVLGGADELDDWALYRIDRYIQLGGRVLFALDYLKINPQLGLVLQPVVDQGLLALVSVYGAEVLPAMVMDRSSLSISFQLRGNTGEIRTDPYPQWIVVPEQNGNPSHPITSRFNGLYLYWASPVEIDPPFGVMGEPLFISSPEAWLQTRNFTANPEDNLFSENIEVDTQGTRILGAALSGIFPGVFRYFQKPYREGYGTELPDLPSVSSPSRIIVIGDADFASSLMEIGQAEARNLDFLLKAADWLNNDEDIISLRRGEQGRLDRITHVKKRLDAMNLSRNINIFVVPVLVLIVGIAVILYRKKTTNGKTPNE